MKGAGEGKAGGRGGEMTVLKERKKRTRKEEEQGRREGGREGGREGRTTYLLDNLDLALVIVREQLQVKDILLLLLLFLDRSSSASPGSSPGTWRRDSHAAQIGIRQTQPMLEGEREGGREGGKGKL